MTLGPPPFPDPVPDETLEALAAGELAPEVERRLRAAAAADPALAARLAAAERFEALLASEELLPLPLSLLARVREQVRAEPRTGYEPVGRTEGRASPAPAPQRRAVARALRAVAAAVLVAVGATLTFGGVEPVSAAADTLRTVGLTPPPTVAGLPTLSASWARVGASASDLGLPDPDAAALVALPADVPGGAPALLAGAAALFACGLALAWRSRLRPASRGALGPTFDGSPS